jgi:uncharacterized protein (DUF58 family)
MRLFRRSEPPPPPSDASEPFDEAFQKRLESLAIVSRRLVTGRDRAERKSTRSGGGVEFAEHRPYVPGDDFRFLDWKVFGRSERLLLKQFEEEQDLCVYLLLDCSGSMAFGDGKKLRYAKQLCAALGYVALANLDRVSVQAFSDGLGQRLAPTRGKNRALTLLRFLDRLESGGPTGFAKGARAFAAREATRGMVVVITDGYDFAGFERGIDALRYARFEPVVLLVTDPKEAEPELHGELTLVDAERGEERSVTITPGMLERYRAAYRAHLAQLESYCRDKQVRAFEMSVEQPFDEAVLELLRRGGFLR